MRKASLILMLAFALVVSALPTFAQDDPCVGRGGTVDTATGRCHASTGVEIEVDIPITLAAYPFAQDTIDAFIKGHYQAFLGWFADTELVFTASFPWSLYITYEEYAHSDTVQSVVFTISEYTGGAHPNSYYMTFTFDLAGERVLALDDLFTDVEAGLTAVMPIARAQLETAMGDMALPDFINPGTEPTPENYANFALTPDSLIIFFPPYQVAPYAAGPQQVTIPLADLAGVLEAEWMR